MHCYYLRERERESERENKGHNQNYGGTTESATASLLSAAASLEYRAPEVKYSCSRCDSNPSPLLTALCGL